MKELQNKKRLRREDRYIKHHYIILYHCLVTHLDNKVLYSINLLYLQLAFMLFVHSCILLDEKFLQFDWLRAVVFLLNLKYLLEKITNLLRAVV